MFDRIMGVITLKSPVYKQIAEDQTATTTAAIIVVIATLVSGFFQGLVQVAADGTSAVSVGAAVIGAIVAVIVGLLGWALSAWVLAFVAQKLGGKTNTGEMLRVTGFVHVFNFVAILTILGAITPALLCVVGLVSLVVAILRLIGYVIGVREAAEFSTGNAVITAIIAAIVQFIIVVMIGGSILAIILAAVGMAGAVAGS